jgi:hypothetical protein
MPSVAAAWLHSDDDIGQQVREKQKMAVAEKEHLPEYERALSSGGLHVL